MVMTNCLEVSPRSENPAAFAAALIQTGIGFSVQILESGKCFFTFDNANDCRKAEHILWR